TSALDRLAIIMATLGESGARYLPIYEKPESELAIYKAREAKMVEIHERARRVKCKEVLP
ncbi:MAG: hypothetical protein M9895_19480, partial [Aquamicrobium sp.]|uniref:hypothetical protein n=1 Tax=Aquamicrobium sp. TaxID=1872579 RepID=UPI00349E6D41|nr:hypothetical protein [Aquamicrobium sp.]